jgi:hypothetical protein
MILSSEVIISEGTRTMPNGVPSHLVLTSEKELELPSGRKMEHIYSQAPPSNAVEVQSIMSTQSIRLPFRL